MQPNAAQSTKSFPLAALAAAIMALVFVVLVLVTSTALWFSKGFSPALNYLLSQSVEIAIYSAFFFFLRKENQIAAALFAIWCIWGFLNAISGTPDSVAAVFGYAFGVLNFVGFAGVAKGFTQKATP